MTAFASDQPHRYVLVRMETTARQPLHEAGTPNGEESLQATHRVRR
jgi:hypothetical protein